MKTNGTVTTPAEIKELLAEKPPEGPSPRHALEAEAERIRGVVEQHRNEIHRLMGNIEDAHAQLDNLKAQISHDQGALNALTFAIGKLP